ncbi:MAG: hypothetical protein M4579_000591 [Chaenotheca gracillima]|nr:MAG: hypothetical protein M4579_000591 [Chaenotheca gracillima]
MPYNTRRKSLSLPSLGIQLPHASRAAAGKVSPPPALSAEQQPPSKKVKRSHTSASPVSPPMATRKSDRPRKAPAYDDTPPPSPKPVADQKVDTEGINDEIVVGAIEQLETTGNKPQLVKELAAVLSKSLSIVEGSANPQAIISSRLNAYLKRPWTALSPCPLAKTLIPSHPRRIYFYLTNTPHQPLPDPAVEAALPSNRRSIISPSLSSEDDEETRKREALSPSPEIDLSTEFEDAEAGPPTPAGSFNGSNGLSRDGTIVPDAGPVGHHHRAVSPPLEGDEKEFEQTASSLQSKRSMSQDGEQTPAQDVAAPPSAEDRVQEIQESEENAARRNFEAAAALFGHASQHQAPGVGRQQPASSAMVLSSPLVKPTLDAQVKVTTASLGETSSVTRHDEMELDVKSSISVAAITGSDNIDSTDASSAFSLGWGSDMITSPENVELDELDDLLGGF